MPITQTSFLRTSAILLVAGFVALLAIIGTTLWLVERAQTSFDEVVAARDMRSATADLRSSLQDAETGQRGFLLTGDESYLEPFTTARDNILPQYEKLRGFLAARPEFSDRAAALREGIDAKLAEMEQTIALARNGRRDEAIQIIRTDRGKALMDQARPLFTEIIEAGDRELVAGAEVQRNNANLLQWVAVLSGIVIVLVVGASVWTALSYTRELLGARREVETLNQGLEQRVQERTDDLIRANEEVQRFAYIVTHDLRAPLVNIMGFTAELDETMKSIQAYVLADGDPLSEQEIKDARTAASEDLPEAIGFIRSSTRKMDGLINAILKISRDGRRPIKAEKIDLKEALEANAESVQHQVAEADGEIRINSDVPSIVTDRMSFEQIIGNLLDNAVKYRAAGRPLEIDVKAKRSPAGRIAIEVADNGRGIAPEDHQRVFDLFRRAGQQAQPGEGIGLAHVRTLVRNLGGDITLDSEFGRGTTFNIVLPADVRTVMRSIDS